MRRHARWLMPALAAAVLTFPALAAEPAAVSVEQDVRAALERFAELLGAGDWQALPDYYADDPGFFWMEEGVVRYRSRAEVAAAYAGLGNAFEQIDVRFDEVRVLPVAADAAAVGVLFEQRMTTAAGTSVEFAGAIAAVMVKRGGSWVFLSGHTASRGSPPE